MYIDLAVFVAEWGRGVNPLLWGQRVLSPGGSIFLREVT